MIDITNRLPGSYWFDALAPEVMTVWGRHPIWGKPRHMARIAYHATATAFMNQMPHDVRNRRLILYYYLAGVFGIDSQSALVEWKDRLPIGTIAPKVLNNVCIAYNAGVERRAMRGTVDITPQVTELYSEAQAGLQIPRAYRTAALCGECLVRPYLTEGNEKELRFSIYPPDSYQVVYDDTGDCITSVTIPVTKFNANTGEYETRFQVWRDDSFTETSYDGRVVPFLDPLTGAQTDSAPNRYGVIPFVQLCIGDGMFDVIEACIDLNAKQWQSDYMATYDSFETWVGVNLAGATPRVGRMIHIEKVVSPDHGGPALPSLEKVGTTGSGYLSIQELCSQRERKIYSRYGVPSYMADDNAGTPPTGIALMIERGELLQRRAADIQVLTDFEGDLLEMVALVAATDKHRVNIQADGLSIGINFGAETIQLEPLDSLQYSVKRLLLGFTSPAAFAEKELALTGATDEEAVQHIMDNLALIAPLRDTLISATADYTTAMAAPPPPPPMTVPGQPDKAAPPPIAK